MSFEHYPGDRQRKTNDYSIEPCRGCRDRRGKGECTISDEMQSLIIPELFQSDGIVLGTPVYFNNVSAQMPLNRVKSLATKRP
ncbi:MAG: flavodoxin family protein [Armatimonadetes bacterium]|nr:flavodoxin family protein [Armatimonadota bacterium]